MLYDRHTGQENKMSKKKSNRILLTAVLLVLAVFAFVAYKTATATYNKSVADETITEPDFYSMTEFSAENSGEVMKALKSGNAGKLEELMIDPTGVEDVMGFANWGDADLDNVISLGAGSLSEAPDKNGKMDVSERFIVPVGDQKYVLFIETLTSRHGMRNEGVTAVAATTNEHFEETYRDWLGQKDDRSVLAGKSVVTE